MFYNFNYFNNLRKLKFVCFSWKIKCLILLMHGATMKLILLTVIADAQMMSPFNIESVKDVKYVKWE